MLRPRRSTQFPQELTDMVIDHLWNDESSLLICSQVARCWLQSSRSHIFREISIRVEDSKPEKLPDFIDLLHPSKQIGHHVRCLILRQRLRQHSFREMDSSHLDIEVMEAILAKLPNLSELFLHGISLTFLSTSETKNLCPPSLQRLSISHVDIFGRLSNVLSYFARVDDLRLGNINVGLSSKSSSNVDGRDASVIPSMSPRCLGIRSLQLQVLQEHPIDQGILLDSLTEFNFRFSTRVHRQIQVVINPIIRLAPRLKYLKLSLMVWGYTDWPPLTYPRSSIVFMILSYSDSPIFRS